MTGSPQTLVFRDLGSQDYPATWESMKTFTDTRDASTADECWLLQHPPVYTLGQAGRVEHVLDAGEIPLVKCDRGGQVTYHGPGQLVAYLLLDIRRRGIGIRQLVDIIEQALIELLGEYAIESHTRKGAPGVYVGDDKIAALGLRIRNGCSYHGLSLNVDMDLEPFSRINPCGYPGLGVTQLKDLLDHAPGDLMADAQARLQHALASSLL